MSLADIDAAATRRRIQDIVDEARKSFEAHAQRSAEIDAAAREAAAREKADLEAALERKTEAEAEAKAETDAEAKRPAAEQEAEDKPRPRPKPSTMSLGAEEFKLDRQAHQAAADDKSAPPKPAPAAAGKAEEPAEEPAGEPAGEAPRRTLKLGARDDDENAPKQDKPARKRSPRPETDDDMSGRTWLR